MSRNVIAFLILSLFFSAAHAQKIDLSQYDSKLAALSADQLGAAVLKAIDQEAQSDRKIKEQIASGAISPEDAAKFARQDQDKVANVQSVSILSLTTETTAQTLNQVAHLIDAAKSPLVYAHTTLNLVSADGTSKHYDCALLINLESKILDVRNCKSAEGKLDDLIIAFSDAGLAAPSESSM
jgi:hypothetical protein